MFGYVKVESPELLVREYELYKAIYCGTCRAMKKCTGCLSSFALSYDFVFLAMVRMVLNDNNTSDLKIEKHRCIAHPIKKRNMVIHDEINYCARSAVVLSYLKVKDDIADRSFFRRIISYMVLPVLSSSKRRARLPDLLEEAREKLSRLSDFEKQREKSIDLVADIFGTLLSDIFSYGLTEEKKNIAKDVGYHLGKVIYEMDALDDYPDDVKSGNYNPYVCIYGNGGIKEEDIRTVRMGIVLELTALENSLMRLDFNGKDAIEHLIKNTLYLGLVHELDKIEKKHRKKQDIILKGEHK